MMIYACGITASLTVNHTDRNKQKKNKLRIPKTEKKLIVILYVYVQHIHGAHRNEAQKGLSNIKKLLGKIHVLPWQPATVNH